MPVLKTPMRACLRITLALILVAASAVASLARGPVSFAPLAAELQGAVVNISTTYIVNSNGRGFPFPNVPESSPLREFFDKLQPQQPPESDEPIESRSLGSGFVIDPNGTIVTNYHVIEGATEVFVAFVDGTRVEARVIGADEKTDLAVLKVNVDRSLKHVELGDSDTALVGDWVVAIGNPFGVGQSVSSGIVSALGRTTGATTDIESFIQTDAAINPGNSGGALLTMRGTLAGINSAIFSKGGGSLGIGFAVPANLVKSVIENGLAAGKVVRPWLGIQGQSLNTDMARSLGLAKPQGVLISNVYEGSAADNGGLLPNDIVMSVDGYEIPDERALLFRISTGIVGKVAKVGIIRDGEPLALTVPLQVAPEIPAREEALLVGEQPLSGVTVGVLSPAFAMELELSAFDRGVVISDIKAGSFGARHRLKVGDVIVQVNGEAVTSVGQLQKLLVEAEKGWEIAIRRNGQVASMRISR